MAAARATWSSIFVFSLLGCVVFLSLCLVFSRFRLIVCGLAHFLLSVGNLILETLLVQSMIHQLRLLCLACVPEGFLRLVLHLPKGLMIGFTSIVWA